MNDLRIGDRVKIIHSGDVSIGEHVDKVGVIHEIKAQYLSYFRPIYYIQILNVNLKDSGYDRDNLEFLNSNLHDEMINFEIINNT